MSYRTLEPALFSGLFYLCEESTAPWLKVRYNGAMAKRSLTVVEADDQLQTTAVKRTSRTPSALKVGKPRAQKARPKAGKAVTKKPAKKATLKVTPTSSASGKNIGSVKQNISTKRTKAVTKKTTVVSTTTTPRTSKVTKRKAVKGSTQSPAPVRDKSILKDIRRDPLGHLFFEKQLREAGFRGLVSSDKLLLDAYSTDESIFSIRPQIILQPENKKDVEIAVSVIGRETKRFTSLSLTPRAAGTGLSGGALTDSMVIDVARNMRRIGEVKSKGSITTITCDPGANFTEVEKVLKKYNVYLPPAPASKDICSIGGAVANNAAGPDSLKHGHMADWVESMEVVLRDGKTYTIEPLTYRAYKSLIEEDSAYAEIVKEVFALLEKHEKVITTARPQTRKNTAGYPLWDVLDTSVAEFKKGKGTFNLGRLITGSQGTVGIITSLTLRTEPIPTDTTLIVLPIFDLDCAGRAILEALKYDPINVEIFDGLTFDLALKNPDFFKERITGLSYYKVMLTLYMMYHVSYRRTIPEFTLMVTLSKEATDRHTRQEIINGLQSCGCNIVRFVRTPEEREMWWQVRRASYTLSKMQDKTKRPAAFLEDMTVPPHNLFGFFTDIKSLFKKYNITAALHGHGGNGHFHFYPLMDFNKKGTAALIERMAEEFFNCAIGHGGSLCGEHNDGIIRTPHLSKMFNKKTLDLFKAVEHIFDPDDIFNPGKKVNPRFNIKDSIRHIN